MANTLTLKHPARSRYTAAFLRTAAASLALTAGVYLAVPMFLAADLPGLLALSIALPLTASFAMGYGPKAQTMCEFVLCFFLSILQLTILFCLSEQTNFVLLGAARTDSVVSVLLIDVCYGFLAFFTIFLSLLLRPSPQEKTRNE